MLLGIASKGSDFGGVKNDRKLFITHMWFAGLGLISSAYFFDRFLGFGLFGVAAMMIERFGRGWSQWRKGHIQSQTLSIFFVFISEIIALAQSKVNRKRVLSNIVFLGPSGIRSLRFGLLFVFHFDSTIYDQFVCLR